VLAAGAWCGPLLNAPGADLPLRPIPLTMSVTERAAPFVQHLIQHMSRHLSVKQLHSGNLIIGGSWPSRLTWSTQPLGAYDALTQADAIVGNFRVACGVVPDVRMLHVLRSWGGVASDTPDHLPFLGPVPGLREAYIAAGGSTFTLGPTVARLLAELLLVGRTSLDVSAYDPARVLRSGGAAA